MFGGGGRGLGGTMNDGDEVIVQLACRPMRLREHRSRPESDMMLEAGAEKSIHELGDRPGSLGSSSGLSRSG
eukprot:CAMPEP_0206278420 /NCGR_PEP_ID=MMETSP0047_2-20121206/37409_1 /ASSEMBLY_ACC=CAM_ASM_000192 /TAXON_ID=195065 /ORGANISM="Chroomonas mesostigmatica_cf, Strain CCMP1168" /LENGTH=71 /DNA_ID=CAMNT_0053708161 /DNA_START=21 /DNA_END=233 /DNA_ORIENTATION=+